MSLYGALPLYRVTSGRWAAGSVGCHLCDENPPYLQSSDDRQGLAFQDGFAHRVTKGFVFISMH